MMDIDVFDLLDEEPVEEDDGAGEDLFARSDDEDVPGATAEDGTANGQDGDDVDVDVSAAAASGGTGDTAQRKKRVVRAPQPKLNSDRLMSARGLPSIRKTFVPLRFAGRGHERADLRLLMSTLEHWCHRLLPSMTFDCALERLEKLGSSKAVQVNVKKMRMGIDLVARSEFVADEPDDTLRGDAAPDAGDIFDELMASAPVRIPAPVQSPTYSPQTNGSAPLVPEPLNTQPPQEIATATKSTLTAEQQERIRRNREAAQLRRMRAKFSAAQPLQSSSPDTTISHHRNDNDDDDEGTLTTVTSDGDVEIGVSSIATDKNRSSMDDTETVSSLASPAAKTSQVVSDANVTVDDLDDLSSFLE